MLKTILSVSGKSGLYKMISQGKNLMIIESLVDQKRIPAYARDKVISLGDILIYTNEEEVPLYKVLNNVKAKENLQHIMLDTSKATPDELRAYFAEVLPDFDRDRVYPTDIKRLISWYNILLDAGITEFDPEEEESAKSDTDDSDAEEENKGTATEVKKESKPVNKVTPKITGTSKMTATPTKQKPATGKMRQRTKQK